MAKRRTYSGKGLGGMGGAGGMGGTIREEENYVSSGKENSQAAEQIKTNPPHSGDLMRNAVKVPR